MQIICFFGGFLLASSLHHLLLCPAEAMSNRVHSYLFTPQHYLLLLEVSSLLLVDEHQVQEVAAFESIVHFFVCRCQVRARKIEPNGNAFTLDRSAVHYLKLVQILSLSDRVLPAAYDLLLYYAQLHVLDLDAN